MKPQITNVEIQNISSTKLAHAEFSMSFEYKGHLVEVGERVVDGQNMVLFIIDGEDDFCPEMGMKTMASAIQTILDCIDDIEQ